MLDCPYVSVCLHNIRVEAHNGLMRSRNARVPNDNYLLLLLVIVGRLDCEGIVHWTLYRSLCFSAAFGRPRYDDNIICEEALSAAAGGHVAIAGVLYRCNI